MNPLRLPIAALCSLAWIVAASPSAADPDAVNLYLAETARPITAADGAWIDPYVGEHRVVLVGEEIHGIAEHITLKGEIAARLVAHHGFTHVLIEDDVFKSDAINDSLRAGALPPLAPLFRSFFWCWNVAEMHAVYDTLASLDTPPTFLGIDVQSPVGALRSLRAAAAGPEQAAAIDSLEGLFAEGRPAYATRTPEARARDTARIDALSTTFADRDIAREQRHLRRVLALWAVAEEHGPRMNARDRGMAMSVQDVLEADPTHKVIVFGHNAHVGYTPFYESFTGGVTPLASHLRDELGVATLSVGVVFATGSTLLDPRAREDNGGPLREHLEPPAESQAAHWIAIPHARWVLDIAAIRRDGAPAAVLDFLAAPPPGYFRNYGPARPLDASYDVIVGYGQVHAATPARE